MGILTLAQIRTEVDSSMGNPTDVTDSRLDTWINLAYIDVATGIDFDELDQEFPIATAASDFDYAGPTNSLIVQLVRDDTSENLLIYVPKQEFYRLSRATEGTPRKWTRRGSEILVNPTPGGVFNLTALYKRSPPALVADGDVTILPSYVDNALIFLGVAYGFLATGEEQRAITWLNRAVAFLSSRLTQQDFSFLLGGLAKTLPERKEAPIGT